MQTADPATGASLSEPSGRILRANSLAEDVYEAIFAQLMSLKIEPGARIRVDSLVREFNVSHTPIREALGRLEGEGLVLRTHLVGYRAAPQISRRRFDEVYELRLLLEPPAAAKAASSLDEGKLAVLQDAAGVMRRLNARDNRLLYSSFARLDGVFHDKVVEFAGNEVIRAALASQHAHFHIFRLMYHERVTEEALDEHTAILSAFEARDPDAAQQAMRIHIEKSRGRLLPAFE